MFLQHLCEFMIRKGFDTLKWTRPKGFSIKQNPGNLRMFPRSWAFSIDDDCRIVFTFKIKNSKLKITPNPACPPCFWNVYKSEKRIKSWASLFSQPRPLFTCSKKMKIEWTEPAISDLQHIRDYIVKDSEYYAARFVSKIINRIDVLPDFPEMGRVVTEAGDKSIRELIYQ
jgi:hypothetical protein